MKSRTTKIIIYFFSLILILASGFLLYGFSFYQSVFRLSYDQIQYLLSDRTSNCIDLKNCKLEPGDIIIRRYVTSTSEIFNAYLNPYFTHSAVYLGNNELFEALGNDQAPQDQIKISKFNDSDWLKGDLNGFVVIRPKNIKKNYPEFEKKLKNIADDPEYTFGPWNKERKKASCSDSIYEELVENFIIEPQSKTPRFITPDYLFWLTIIKKNEFELIGFSIRPKI